MGRRKQVFLNVKDSCVVDHTDQWGTWMLIIPKHYFLKVFALHTYKTVALFILFGIQSSFSLKKKKILQENFSDNGT